MRHKVKKIRFGIGQDANSMLLRKLASNFFLRGSITTTHKRAKALKQHLDTLVGKIGEKSEANKNILLKYLGSSDLVDQVFSQVSEASKASRGGYVRIQKLLFRPTDGSGMAKVTWSKPVVIESKPKKIKPKEKKVKTEK